jgi:zinc protease
MMGQLTVEDVNAAIKRHLRYDNVQIAIVTGDAEGIAKALAADTPTPITYDTQKSEAILNEDKEIAAFPLGVKADAIRTVQVDQVFQR